MAGGVWPGPAASWLAGIRLLRDFEAPAFARVSGPGQTAAPSQRRFGGDPPDFLPDMGGGFSGRRMRQTDVIPLQIVDAAADQILHFVPGFHPFCNEQDTWLLA